MAGYIGTQAVSVNTTSATISDDLSVGDDATITGDLDVDGTTNLDVVDIDGAVNIAAATTIATNNKIQFRDAAIHISSPADGDLAIAADDEIDITSTLIDVNGNLDVSGTTVTAGNLSVGSGTPAYVLDVEGATSGDWLAHLYNSHATNGYGLKVKAGDNQDVTSFRVSNQDNSLTFLNVYGNGVVSMLKQPGFSATVNATQSNLAVDAAVRVKFAVVTFDNNSNFTVSTGDGQGGDGSNVTAVFTAPVGGKYQLNLMLRLANLDAASAYYIVSIHTTLRLYRFIWDPDFGQDTDYWASSLAVLADMDINDTAFVSVVQHSGTAQTDVEQYSDYTRFSGYLVA